MPIKIENLSVNARKHLAKNSLENSRVLLADNENLVSAMEELQNAKHYLTGLDNAANDLTLIENLIIYTRYLAFKKDIALSAAEKETGASFYNTVRGLLTEEERNQPNTPTLASLTEQVSNPDTALDSKKLISAIYQELLSQFFIPAFTIELSECGNDIEKINALEKKLDENEKNVPPNFIDQFKKIKMDCLCKKLAIVTKKMDESEFPATEEGYPEQLEISKKILESAKVNGNDDEHYDALKKHYHLQRQYAKKLIAHHKNNLTESKSNNINDNKNTAYINLHTMIKSLGHQSLKALLADKKIDAKTARQLAVHLHFISCSYYDLAICADSSQRAAHCINEASRYVDFYFDLIKELEELPSDQEGIEMINLKQKLEKNPSAKTRMHDLATRYKTAKAAGDHKGILDVGNDLAEAILEESSPDSQDEDLTLQNIFLTVADSSLKFALFNEDEKRSGAIKALKYARNVGPLKADAEAKLVELLEAELAAHAHDHLRRFIEDDLLAIRKKMRASMTASSTSVQGSISPTTSSAPTNPFPAATAINLSSIFDQFARNDSDLFSYFKSNFGNNSQHRQALLNFILSKTDEELKTFSPHVLHAVAINLIQKKDTLPPEVSRNKKLKTFFGLTMAHPHLTVEANFYLGEIYQQELEYDRAKICFEKAVPHFPHAYLSLSYIHLMNNDYEGAKMHLNTALSSPRASDRLKAAARYELNRIFSLEELNKNIPQTPMTPQTAATASTKPKGKPLIIFDIDNTIFRTSGNDGRFFWNLLRVRIAPENANVADYYIGGPDAWREIFNELRVIGFDIGICTAKAEIAKEIDPLYKDLLNRFPDIFKDNPYIIFTDGQSKHPPIVEMCRLLGFNRSTRKYCMLVDDDTGHATQVRVRGLNSIHIPTLAVSTNPETFTAFKEHLLREARKSAELFYAHHEESATFSSEEGSEEGEAETATAVSTTSSTTASLLTTMTQTLSTAEAETSTHTASTAQTSSTNGNHSLPNDKKRTAAELPTFVPRPRTDNQPPPPRRTSGQKRSLSARDKEERMPVVDNTIALGGARYSNGSPPRK